MPTLSLDAIAALMDGQMDIRRRPDSIQPLRFVHAEAPFYDAFTRWVASCPTAVRLRFATEATALTLRVNQRTLAFPDQAERQLPYDLCIDGRLFERAYAEGGATVAPDGSAMGDERAIVTFTKLPPGRKAVELWLPQTGTVSISGLDLEDGEAVAWPDERRTVLFHGSSITHCMEADGPTGGWPQVAAALADVRVVNLGWGGSCLLSGLAARMIRDTPADAIVLKLGINVHPEGMLKERTFLDSAHAMISIIRERRRETPIQIISPIFSPPREDHGDRGGLSLMRMRELLESVVQARIRAGDAHIGYLSGLELFGPADADDLPDDLHPNTAGYRRMGERFHAQRLSGEQSLL